MNTKSLFLAILLFLCSSVSFSQLLRDHEVDESTVKPWLSEDINEYCGVYIFSPNDGNYLIVVVNDSIVSAQIHFPHFWHEVGYGLELGLADSSEFEFHSEYINLTGVKIQNGKFISNQYQGEFVSFSSDTIYHSIKIYNSWNRWHEYSYEIGVKTKTKFEEFFKGDYPEASYKLLDSNYLSSYSKYELRLIRNEIYARYNYKFKEGSEMQKYFENKEWYTNSAARYRKVSHQFTRIELLNINLIKKLENKK